MRIGLDLDGVIVDSIDHWIRVFNRETRANYGPGDLPNTYATPEEAAVSDRFELEMLIAPGPMPGALEALTHLADRGHELVVVTARAPRLQRLTEAWLGYYGIHMHAMHFLEGGNKGPVARREGLAAFVEDAPHNALALVEAGVPVLLFDAPYNREVVHPLVRRCEGWGQVLERLAEP